MRISDWSSDVCSSDLVSGLPRCPLCARRGRADGSTAETTGKQAGAALQRGPLRRTGQRAGSRGNQRPGNGDQVGVAERSEEHTSELQSLMRISYAVFCLKQKTPEPYNKE